MCFYSQLYNSKLNSDQAEYRFYDISYFFNFQAVATDNQKIRLNIPHGQYSCLSFITETTRLST
jgi:hypothetical protein